MFNLGGVLGLLGKRQEVEIVMKRLFSLLQHDLGRDSPQALGTMSNLRDVLAEQGKYEEADRLSQDGLDLVSKLCGSIMWLKRRQYGNKQRG